MFVFGAENEITNTRTHEHHTVNGLKSSGAKLFYIFILFYFVSFFSLCIFFNEMCDIFPSDFQFYARDNLFVVYLFFSLSIQFHFQSEYLSSVCVWVYAFFIVDIVNGLFFVIDLVFKKMTRHTCDCCILTIFSSRVWDSNWELVFFSSQKMCKLCTH